MKIRPVGAELFHADGRTDRHNEGNSHFSLFYEPAYKGERLVWFTSYIITFVRFEVLPVATVMFTLKMEAAITTQRL
jgi:hypothetical protein